MKLYMTERSGDAYKAELLHVSYEPVMVDLAAGENRTPPLLASNPSGRPPSSKTMAKFIGTPSPSSSTSLASTSAVH